MQHTKEEDQSGLAGDQQAENMDLEEAEEAEEKTEFGHEEPVGPDANNQTDSKEISSFAEDVESIAKFAAVATPIKCTRMDSHKSKCCVITN